MQITSAKRYSLEYNNTKTYLIALLFVLGNLALPQLCHSVHLGGPIWLPIYFFTLVGAYKFGWHVGLLTAVASPLLNSALFDMPLAAALPAILLKSVLLALAAEFAASHFKRATIPLLTVVVLGYQVIGTLGEWAMVSSLHTAAQDFRIGVPGMIVQIFGGYVFINYFIRK